METVSIVGPFVGAIMVLTLFFKVLVQAKLIRMIEVPPKDA